ncbi:MAG: FecR domain-containing protein [Bacteriovorax sp.]|jgi:hypothetical protein
MNFKTILTAILFSLTIISSAIASGFMQVANVTKIQGTATVKTEKYEEKLKVGDEITEGMTVAMSNPKSFIEVKFQNGHLVRFVGASVKVETLNPKNTLFNLIKGKIFSAIKPLTQDETFDVKTKRASFAVRGTRFYLDESKKNSYLCVCEGTVAAKTGKGEVAVSKDEDLKIANSKSELKKTPASKMMVDMGNQVFGEMGVL